MKFLIQTVNEEIRGTEEFNLKRIIEKSKRIYDHSCKMSEKGDIDNVEDYIPVGDLNFVAQHLRRYHNVIHMNPIEIPKAMRIEAFLGRYYKILKRDELPDRGFGFIKNAGDLKVYSGQMALNPETKKYLDGEIYQISDYTPFVSEYRVFVLNGVIEAVQHYKEDPMIFPDAKAIKAIVDAYRDIPGSARAFTADIGVDEKGRTLLIEIHSFVSCGTYGFEDDTLLQMYKLGYDYYINNNLPIELDS